MLLSILQCMGQATFTSDCKAPSVNRTKVEKPSVRGCSFFLRPYALILPEMLMLPSKQNAPIESFGDASNVVG